MASRPSPSPIPAMGWRTWQAPISQARQTGAEVILCTGGMSVDPDDNTPRRDQAERGEDRHLRRPGACPALCSCWATTTTAPPSWACRLRHVRRGHHLRPSAALGGGGCKRHQGVDRSPWGRAACVSAASPAAGPSAPLESKNQPGAGASGAGFFHSLSSFEYHVSLTPDLQSRVQPYYHQERKISP